MPFKLSGEAKKYIDGLSDSEIIKKIMKISGDTFKNEGMCIISRIEKKRSIGISIINGEINGITTNAKSGIGVHCIDKAGASAFISSNTYPAVDFEDIMETIKKLINSSSAQKIKTNVDIFQLKPEVNIKIGEYKHPLKNYSLDQIISKLKETNLKIKKINDKKLSVATNFSVVQDEFIIIRGDGTFSAFDMPRCAFSNSITAKDQAGATTVHPRLGSSDLSVLFDDELYNDLLGQSVFYADEALKVLSAPKVKPGKYKIVIDYALAKGLAHEAFGHAAESDLHKGSILWENDKFIKGRKIASDMVSIEDGPIFNDYAWQPVGANGNLRKTVEIVKDGVINKSLADIFSNTDAGTENQNCERIESFECPSIPRMTNIRLSYKNPIKTDKKFHEITPADVNKLIVENKLMPEDPETEILLLLGYKGGQVSTVNGDFVFNCSMIYKMNHDCNPELYQPAIFAGKTLSTLKSISGAIGPIKYDALGTCGKNGQGVPSSGGSNYFVIVDKNDDITIG